MLECAATVLAALDTGGGGDLDEGGVEVGFGERGGCGRGRDLAGCVAVLYGDGREGEGNLGRAGSLRDGANRMGGVAADELVRAVYHHLRGVGAIGAEALGVGGLALGELVGGEAVAPAEGVPIVDVFAEDDDVGGGDGLFMQQAREEGVGGRATGAALGGEELYEDGRAGG